MGRWSDLARKFEVGRMSLPDNRQKPAERNEDHVSTAITSFEHNRQEQAKSPTDDTVADFLPVSTSKKGTRENPTDNRETTFLPVSAGCRERKSIGDRPITWTGKVVGLEDWRRLSEWERHGPNGRVWNGLARQWKP